MLHIQHVSIGYSTGAVVQDISAQLSAGDFVCVLGPNGAGKSTLFKTLIGILRPLSGDIFWDLPKRARKSPFHELGFSPQSQMLDWYTTVFDNVLLGPILAGMSVREARSETKRALRLMGLSELANKSVDHLSGGQQQRVQIARELARKPSVYILDEPTVGLDVEASEDLMRYLKQEAENGALVLVSTHDLSLIEAFASKLLYLSDGKARLYQDIASYLQSGMSLRESYLMLREGGRL